MQIGSVNKVVLVGHLGGDPETRFTPSGTAVANFNIATNESWKDANGELQDKTEWHRCVMFGKTAELYFFISSSLFDNAIAPLGPLRVL